MVGNSYHNHVTVVDAIAARDAGAAEEAMVVHLDELIHDIDVWLGKLVGVRRARHREA